MQLLLAYGAGLLTLINPCVLPVLPIVLASGMQAGRHGPLALAAGMSVSFVALGMFVATVGYSIGLDAERMAQIGASLMIGFGLVLLVPRFSAAFATATGGLSGSADARMGRLAGNTRGQFLGGALLGAVWSPCVGPTLGGAISLASQGQSLLRAAAIMTGFALGVSTVMLLLGYGTREAIMTRRDRMRAIAERSKPVMGIVFAAVGLMILTGAQYTIEGWLLDRMPVWLQDFSVSI
ncbi:MAG: cytochrome c biogenesis CcdA family protein [Paracoccaceae bacterium]